MDQIRFQIDLNLQSISMLSIATKLWDIPDIKKKIKMYCSSGTNQYRDIERIKIWNDLSGNVIHYLNTLGLPTGLLIPLQKKVVLVGEKIKDWIHYVTKVLKLDFIFAEKIYWSSYGAVDEIKMFDFYWRELMAVTDFKTDLKYFKHNPLFSIACIFGHTKFINDHADEMIDELGKFYFETRKKDRTYNIISSSVCLTVSKNASTILAKPQDMFKLCIKAGFSRAARFFWEKLNEIQKILKVDDLAEKCVPKRSEIFFEEEFFFLEERRWDVLILLIDEMGEREKRMFLTKYADKIIMAFLTVWPYQELIVTLFAYDWNMGTKKTCDLLKFVVKSNDSECSLCNKIYFEIVQKIWEKIPEDGKVSFVKDNGAILFLNFNISVLNLILKDPNIRSTEVAEDAMDIGCVELAKMGKFDLIDEFVEKILSSNQMPKEKLKRNYSDILLGLAENDDFKGADCFLDWISDSAEEKTCLKNEANIIEVLEGLTVRLNDFKLAHKYLSWQFETEAEVEGFKNEMKSSNFIRSNNGRYLRIKSGNLREVVPGDFVALKTDDFKNRISSHGFNFFKYDPLRGVVTANIVGVKSSDATSLQEIMWLDDAMLIKVKFVGTKPGDYILQNVYKLFRTRDSFDTWLPKNIDIVNGFIKFYYGTDEEVVQFKKNIFKDLDSVYLLGNLYENLRECKYFGIFNDVGPIFTFFQMSPDEIKALKIRIRNDIENLVDVYLINRCYIDLMDFCSNWLFGPSEENERAETMKKIINSCERGTLLCVSVSNIFNSTGIHTRVYEITLDNRQYLDICMSHSLFFWLKLVEDVEKLRNDPRLLNANPPPWLLDKLREAEEETDSDYAEIKMAMKYG